MNNRPPPPNASDTIKSFLFAMALIATGAGIASFFVESAPPLTVLPDSKVPPWCLDYPASGICPAANPNSNQFQPIPTNR